MREKKQTLTPGIYRHFKGNLYRVSVVAKHCETEEEHVVYRALYGERGLWIRPLSVFCETIERGGVVRPRFEFQPDLTEDDALGNTL